MVRDHATVVSATGVGWATTTRETRVATREIRMAAWRGVAATEMSSTAAAREVRAAAPSTTTVGFTGSSRQRRPGGDRDSGQHSESPGENSSMFRGHGDHSVAGCPWAA
jgi:hypothetical protein